MQETVTPRPSANCGTVSKRLTVASSPVEIATTASRAAKFFLDCDRPHERGSHYRVGCDRLHFRRGHMTNVYCLAGRSFSVKQKNRL